MSIANFWVIIIGRIIVGFGVGISYTVMPIYVKEFTPKSLRATTSILNPILKPVSVIAGILVKSPFYIEALNFNIPSYWRYVVLFPILVLLLRLAALIFILPETPY